MDLGLTGKVALVPAASSGLGRAVAKLLAAEGAKICLCNRDGKGAEQVAREIREAGGEAIALAADVRKPEDLSNMVSTAVDHFGGLDILIVNAGGPPPGTFDKLTDQDWQAAFELTLMSAVRLVRLALPRFRERGGGNIVFMSSSSIKQPIPNLLLSNSLRAAVAGLAKTLADEVSADNIRVNTVIPGRFATPRIIQLDKSNAERAGIDLKVYQEQMEREQAPMARYGDPDEFANAVVFVASERASYITGSTIQVDGGSVRSLW